MNNPIRFPTPLEGFVLLSITTVIGAGFFLPKAELRVTEALPEAATQAVAQSRASVHPPVHVPLSVSASASTQTPQPQPQDKLADYLLDAMIDWVPARYQKPEEESAVYLRYIAISQAVANVVRLPHEKPLYGSRVKTGLTLLAQGAVESGFKSWVGDGSCNDYSWRQRHGQLQCDMGIAFGYAQMHINDQGGVVLSEDGGWLWGNVNEDEKATVIKGRDAIASLETQFLVQLHWTRTTPQAWGSHWAARSKAAQYFLKHPFKE